MPLKAAADVLLMGLSATATVTGSTVLMVADDAPTILSEKTLVPLGAIVTCAVVTLGMALKIGGWRKGIEKDIESLRDELRYLRKIVMRVLPHKDVDDT